MSRSKNRDGIQKLGPGHYRIVLELERDLQGKRVREYRIVWGTLEDAKAARASLQADKARGEHVGRSDQRLADYLESWLAWKRSRVSERTWERYSSLLKSSLIPTLGNKKLQELTPQHLDDYYAVCLAEKPKRELDAGPQKRSHKRKPVDGKSSRRRGEGLSPSTVHHRHVALKMALRRAVELGLIVRNPADFTKPPRPSRPEMRVLDEAETGRMLAACMDTPLELPAHLALMTGARLGEILGLRWSDIDFNGQVMYVRQALVEHNVKQEGDAWYFFKEPKSGKGRAVDLDRATAEKLKTHRKTQTEQRLYAGSAWSELDLVITTPLGEPVRPSSVSTRFREIAESLGFERLRFHDCRHTHATILLKATVPPHVVSKRLGHASVAFTLQVYGWVLPGQQREAADIFAAAISDAGHSATTP
jgi:integrase